MKTQKKLALAALISAFILGGLAIRGGQIIIGSMATWTSGTHYSAGVSLGTVNVQLHSFTIQTGGLVATNDLPLYGQVSLDSNNWTTVTGTWYPSSTNAGYYIWTVPATNLTLYGRAVGVTTNTVTLSGQLN